MAAVVRLLNPVGNVTPEMEPTEPVRLPVNVVVNEVVTVVAALVPAMKRPPAAPGVAPEVYRLLPMDEATVKSPAVVSCQMPVATWAAVSWFVTVVTVG